MEKLELAKLNKNISVCQNQLDVKSKKRFVNLVGQKPMLNCLLNSENFRVLWDTGSMVSVVDKAWVTQHFPENELLSVEEVLGDDKLEIRAANDTEISLEGVILLQFSLRRDSPGFTIPFLVTDQKISEPIVGYNVIEHLVINGEENEICELKSALIDICPKTIEPIIALIHQKAKEPDLLLTVKTQSSLNIPAGSCAQIKCRIKLCIDSDKKTIHFVPKVTENADDELTFSESITNIKRGKTQYLLIDVINPTKSSIWLKKGMIVGSVHSVSAVIPLRLSVNEISCVQNGDVKKLKIHNSKIDEANFENGEKWLPKVDLSHLNNEQREKVKNLLLENCEVFSKSDSDIGNIQDFQMKINLTDTIPVKEAYRRIPRHLYEEVKNYIEDLITNGWVRESFSAYASPIVCVRKKDGSLRMCVDYRKLNNKTVPDSQPIPRIQDILDNLGKQAWFSTLDMSKAYHQGYISEESRHVTAFSTPWALFEWVRIPFGLRNAPPGFQRYINQCLGDLKVNVCESYLDDILGYSQTFEEHLEIMSRILQRLRKHGIKLRSDKCVFFKQEVRYLGRLISKHGYRPDPKDTAALEKFRSPPKTLGELRSLLGFLGYYRCYVKDFAKKMRPLYSLLKIDSEQNSGKRNKINKINKIKKLSKNQNYNAKQLIDWNENLQNILNELINYLKSPEVISYPDFDIPFFVTCDACNDGLGAVLYQKQNGVNRVISFASRTLSDAEKKYHLHSGKLEFLALKWAITEKFSDYLKYGPSFVVYTDNNPLTYVMTTAKLNASGLRWVAELSDYDFSLQYRPGKVNKDADGLSRNPIPIEQMQQNCTKEINPENTKVLMTSSKMPCCSISIDELELGDKSDNPVETSDLIEKQMSDPVVGPVYQAVSRGTRPQKDVWKVLNRKSKVLLHQFNKLQIENGVLIRKTVQYKQIVLPDFFHKLVMIELHENMAHLAGDRVEELARQRFYWAYMWKDIDDYIKKKCSCVISKQPNRMERAPLVPIDATYPFEMISIDFLHLDKCKGGFQYVLVVCDHFTRFSQAYATKSKSSQAAAEKLFNNFVLQYGFPKRIHHDKGKEFNSNLFFHLHKLAGIRMSNTTPYHPMGDGQVERMNRTLCNMLKSIPENEKNNWKEHLPKLMFAYNSTINKTTGFSPFFLMFGRSSRLPIDSIFPNNDPEGNSSYGEFVTRWKMSMDQAYKIANEQIKKSSTYNKQKYDKQNKAKSVEIIPGDRVLVKNVRDRGGTGKLRSFWEQEIYEVVSKHDELPVYKIKPLGTNRVRTIHRNLIKGCNELPIDVLRKSNVVEKSVVKKSKVLENLAQSIVEMRSDDSEDDEVVVIRNRESPLQRGMRIDEVVPDDVSEDFDEHEDGAEVQEDVDEEVEDVLVEPEVVPVDENDDDDDDDSDGNDSSETVLRRSSRSRNKKKIFTYHKVGGRPLIEH